MAKATTGKNEWQYGVDREMNMPMYYTRFLASVIDAVYLAGTKLATFTAFSKRASSAILEDPKFVKCAAVVFQSCKAISLNISLDKSRSLLSS